MLLGGIRKCRSLRRRGRGRAAMRCHGHRPLAVTRRGSRLAGHRARAAGWEAADRRVPGR
jgi:hypothetical protein